MKLEIKLVFLVGLVFLLFSFSDTSQLISIVLQKCYCYCNNKYCNATVLCRPLNRTSKLSSIDIYMHEGVKLEEPVYIETIAYRKFRTQYRQSMLNIKLELCSQLKNKDHPFFRVFYTVDFIKGNFLDPCPILGHRYIKPQISNYDHFPLIPVGEWRLDTIISKNINKTDVVIMSWSDFYEVKPTGAEQF